MINIIDQNKDINTFIDSKKNIGRLIVNRAAELYKELRIEIENTATTNKP